MTDRAPADLPRETLRAGATPRAWLTLATLMLVGLYMYADRNVIVLQVEPMRAALGLSDFQIGLVQGLSIALFAGVAGYPIAWLADRYDGRFIISISLLVWCAAVAACGLAGNFTELFLASAVVGIGEAALLPITYATIPELFRGRARILANALVTVIGRLASGIVIALSGLLVQYVGALRPALPTGMAGLEDWRLALIMLAIPGPLLALAVLGTRLRVTSLGTAERSVASRAAPIWPYLSAQRAPLGALYIGVGLLVFGMSALGAFLPVVAIRQMGATPAIVGAQMGSATLISTLVALAGLALLAPRLARRFGPSHSALLLASAAFLPALIMPAFLLAETPGQLFILLALCFLPLSMGAMAFPTALQDFIPRQLRTRLIAVSILVNIILSALAPAVVGLLSDRLSGWSNGLLVAIAITASISLFASAAAMAFAFVRYEDAECAARAEEASGETA